MWIFSELGFFSIVKQGKVWHVRARERADLVNLASKLKSPPEVLQSFPGSDYPWRMIVNGRQKAALFRALEATVEYSNFKGHIASLPDQRRKLGAYHEVWHLMREI